MWSFLSTCREGLRAGRGTCRGMYCFRGQARVEYEAAHGMAPHPAVLVSEVLRQMGGQGAERH